MSKVLIGNAVCDENGGKGSSSSQPGNQTTQELRIQDWYCKQSSPWKYVFRADEKKVADTIAQTMEDACNNMAIGYNQTRRTTLYDRAKEKSWKVKKITKACECDCSSLVAVCINSAGIKIDKDMYTGDEKELIQATGKFATYTSDKYTLSSDYLKRGDILLKDGHTAIVLTDGSKVNGTKTYEKYVGTSVSIVDALNTIGVNSSFLHRKKIAKANGIKAYIGTAKQNTKMLSLLREGKLIMPK